MSVPDIPLVALVMGSRNDFPTLQRADQLLSEFGIPHIVQVISAHRTPDRLAGFAAGAADAGLEVIIAGAGGAAHLPGMIAAWTHLPVLGVPIESKALQGMDSLLSIVQMPAGVPVGTLSIGVSGAVNAALLAVSILALSRTELRAKLIEYRQQQTAAATEGDLPSGSFRR